jgi:hypothetical protein
LAVRPDRIIPKVAFHARQVHALKAPAFVGEEDVALELRPNCEYCDTDLPPDSSRRAHLQLRMHLLRRLRRAASEQCLPQLRRRPRPAADQAGAGVAAGIIARQAAGLDETGAAVL